MKCHSDNDSLAEGQGVECLRLFIIMEEQQHFTQIIHIFLRSSQIEQLNIDIFDSCDSLIDSFILKNYKRHTIRLKQQIRHFYCVLTNHSRDIEEQLEVKIADEQGNSLQMMKKLANLAITIDVQLRRPVQNEFVLEHFLQQQNELVKFANTHLRKLEASVIKKLEIEELKKPFRQKTNNSKGPSFRKMKCKLHLTTLIKLPSGSEKKGCGKGFVETLKSLGKGKHKITDQSQPSLQEPNNQPTLRNKKYNTVFQNNPVQNTQPSSKDLHVPVIAPNQPQPFYDLLVKAIQSSFFPSNKRILRKTRQARFSHNQELIQSTLNEIEKQKKALQMMKSISGNYSHQTSPIKNNEQKINKPTRTSPYLPLSSKAFIKRKIK